VTRLTYPANISVVMSVMRGDSGSPSACCRRGQRMELAHRRLSFQWTRHLTWFEVIAGMTNHVMRTMRSRYLRPMLKNTATGANH
jgi:hypothetical protein